MPCEPFDKKRDYLVEINTERNAYERDRRDLVLGGEGTEVEFPLGCGVDCLFCVLVWKIGGLISRAPLNESSKLESTIQGLPSDE
jgi:hypothetical protein